MKKTYKNILISLLIIVCFIISTRLFIFLFPSEKIKTFCNNKFAIKYYDRNDKLLRWTPSADGSWQTKVTLKETPKKLVKAIIIAEDKRFYFHNGVDIFAISRAFFLNFAFHNTISGASTITMQLARLIYPHSQGVKGKIFEAFYSRIIEIKKSKKWILEQYINNIPFGYNTKGYVAAANIYFNKDLIELTDEEISILSVIPRGPTKYNPFKEQENVKKAAGLLLSKITKQDLTICEQKIMAVLNSMTKTSRNFDCPHFVEYVINKTNKDINSQYQNKIESIKTTIDLDLQNQVQNITTSLVGKYNKNRLTNAAVLVLNENNEIISYVGSCDFFDIENSGQIDGVQIKNQPGSTLKPFLYALALENNFTPNMILPDIPLNIGGEENYKPSNYNLRTNGPIRMRVALASSLNIPAVYLINRLGIYNFISNLKSIYFDSLDNTMEYPGAGLALGNSPVKLYELTRAFSIFSHNGVLKEVTPFKAIKINGNWQNFESSRFYKDEKIERTIDKKIYSDETNFLIYNILTDENARSLGFGHSKFFQSKKIAVKTGTSNQFGNIWALATCGNYTIGVWAGNFNGHTVQGVPGAGLPLEIAKKITDILPYDESKIPTCPDTLELKQICSLSGQTPTHLCDSTMYEYFPKQTNEENGPCTYHKQAPNGVPYVSYPKEYLSWARTHNKLSHFQIYENDNNKFEIYSPTDKSVYFWDPYLNSENQAITLKISYQQAGNILLYSINGGPLQELPYPYETQIPLSRGQNVITVMTKNRSQQETISYTVK